MPASGLTIQLFRSSGAYSFRSGSIPVANQASEPLRIAYEQGRVEMRETSQQLTYAPAKLTAYVPPSEVWLLDARVLLMIEAASFFEGFVTNISRGRSGETIIEAQDAMGRAWDTPITADLGYAAYTTARWQSFGQWLHAQVRGLGVTRRTGAAIEDGIITERGPAVLSVSLGRLLNAYLEEGAVLFWIGGDERPHIITKENYRYRLGGPRTWGPDDARISEPTLITTSVSPSLIEAQRTLNPTQGIVYRYQESEPIGVVSEVLGRWRGLINITGNDNLFVVEVPLPNHATPQPHIDLEIINVQGTPIGDGVLIELDRRVSPFPTGRACVVSISIRSARGANGVQLRGFDIRSKNQANQINRLHPAIGVGDVGGLTMQALINQGGRRIDERVLLIHQDQQAINLLDFRSFRDKTTRRWTRLAGRAELNPELVNAIGGDVFSTGDGGVYVTEGKTLNVGQAAGGSFFGRVEVYGRERIV